MKKLTFLFLGSVLSSASFAQQWSGSTTTTNRIYRTGDITAIDGYSARVTLGAAWGGSPIWGQCYLGFNLIRDAAGNWSFLGGGGTNSGAAMYSSGNKILFSIKNSTGSGAGSINDAAVVNNTMFRMDGNGTADMLKGDFHVRPDYSECVTIGSARGGVSGLSGGGCISFNLSRDNISGANTWAYNTDGTQNGGSAIYGRMDGDIVFSVKPNTGSGTGLLTDAQVMQNSKFRFTNSGKLIIASQTVNITGGSGASLDFSSNNYNLFVEKGILTERIRVAVKGSTEWADYVFDKKYKLMPLKDLATFINKEKHLPNIPTTEQVIKEGVDLGEMQARLLQKVEELTQYILLQQKEIEELKEHLNHH